MKAVLVSLYTILCLIFSVIWAGLIAYGMGMGGMGGSTDVDSFSRFWMTAPLILSTLCVFAAWLRLGNGVKIGFGLILVSAAALSSFLHYDGYSVEKIWMIILGSAPLSVLLIAWMFSSKSNREGEQAAPRNR